MGGMGGRDVVDFGEGLLVDESVRYGWWIDWVVV